MSIYLPNATFRAFQEEYPLLTQKLLRWASISSREFPDDTRFDRNRTPAQFVERYVHDFLLSPPKTHLDGTKLMGFWAAHLSKIERNQISRLFGEKFEFDMPDHWYVDPQDEYLVLHEQTLEIYQNSTSLDGVKTLNSYGAEILNCNRMLIVDVDLKEDGTDKCVVALSKEMALNQLKLVSQGTDLSWRIYRTAGGLRYVETSQEWCPYAQNTSRLMSLLYADPLYALLCKKQETFRARLTPKPWRSEIVDRNKDYRSDYHSQQSGSQEAVCELIAQIGKKEIFKPFKQLVDIHDSVTKATPRHRSKSKSITYQLT